MRVRVRCTLASCRTDHLSRRPWRRFACSADACRPPPGLTLSLSTLVPSDSVNPLRRSSPPQKRERRSNKDYGKSFKAQPSAEDKKAKRKQILSSIGEDLLVASADKPFRFPATFTCERLLRLLGLLRCRARPLQPARRGMRRFLRLQRETLPGRNPHSLAATRRAATPPASLPCSRGALLHRAGRHWQGPERSLRHDRDCGCVRQGMTEMDLV